MSTTRERSNDQIGLDQNYHELLNLPFSKIDLCLELIHFGQDFPEIYLDGAEYESGKKMTSTIEIDPKLSVPIFSALFNIAMSSRNETTIKKKANYLRDCGFNEEMIQKYDKIAHIFKENSAFKSSSKVAKYLKMEREVLPNLAKIDCGFDVRCKINQDKVTQALPVVLLKFQITDSNGVKNELVFQATIGSLRNITRSLTKTYRKAIVLRKCALSIEGKT